MDKKIVFSGVQPSGEIHLGNYLGALKQFANLQNTNNCIFSIVDLHAITVWQDPQLLPIRTREVLAIFIASGIDPKKNIIFNQSQVSEHAQLAWILGCTAKIGWLNRMTQFKDKAGKDKEAATVGLYTYPILMAADILLYKATHVPVGDDQKQHLELARDIAQKFNTDYKKSYFTVPESLINKAAPRIMSLRDGKKKMSKSDPSGYSRIMMTDTNDEVLKKVMKAKTDSLKMPTSIEGAKKRPEIENLINIFSACSETEKENVVEKFASQDISAFKKELANCIIKIVEPIASETKKLLSDKEYLDKTLRDGAKRAKDITGKSIIEIKEIIGVVHKKQ
ncbi:MAG: tryptophan--tRNA ligase [Pseudomonadota bacterium]|nr:tryptophan--tRNA ligase [Pseudomonadota bacterium]